MQNYSQLSNDGLRARIKSLEASGHSARTSPEMEILNREQTARLSDSDLLSLIRSRATDGKPIAKLAQAARERGLPY